MKKIISYKFKCKKIKSHIEKDLIFQASIVRSVWNKFVDINIKRLSSGKEILPFNYKSFKYLKENDPKCHYWAEGSATFTNYMLHSEKDIFKPFITKEGKLRDNLQLSKSAYKRKKTNPNYKVKVTDYKGFPQFHSYKDHCSFKAGLSGNGFTLDIKNSRVHFTKVGGKNDFISFIKHREIEGIPKNVGIKREGNNWYLNIQCELDIPDPIHTSKEIVGIDKGVAKFVACSNGDVYDSMNFLIKNEKKLTFLQRRYSKKRQHYIDKEVDRKLNAIGLTGMSENDIIKLKDKLRRSVKVPLSNRMKKVQERISKLSKHIANSRINYIHHVSKDLTDKYSLIVMEDLKCSNMTKSAKGNETEPGKNVKAKSKLNKRILDQGWGYLNQQLTYKSNWKGGRIEKVDPKFTSMKCSICGHISSDNRKSQSEFVCEVCGHTENADINAAKNILAVGISVTAQGGNQVAGPMNCEDMVSRVQLKTEDNNGVVMLCENNQLVDCN